jgi:hypothetical protein
MPFGASNYLNVGPGGTFKRSGAVQSHPSDVDQLIANLQTTGRKKIAIHFHGGLVAEADGMKIAEKLVPVYEAAGAHALTFVWETGALETIRSNIDRVWQTELFQLLLKKLLEKVLGKLGVTVGGKGLGRTLTKAEIDAELQKPRPFADVKFTDGGKGRSSCQD